MANEKNERNENMKDDKATAIREELAKAADGKKAAVRDFERAAENFIKAKLERLLAGMDDADGVKVSIDNCAYFSLRIPSETDRPYYSIDFFYTRCCCDARRTLKMSLDHFGSFGPGDKSLVRLVTLAGRVAFELGVLEDRISEFDWDGFDRAVAEMREATDRAREAFDRPDAGKEVA